MVHEVTSDVHTWHLIWHSTGPKKCANFERIAFPSNLEAWTAQPLAIAFIFNRRKAQFSRPPTRQKLETQICLQSFDFALFSFTKPKRSICSYEGSPHKGKITFATVSLRYTPRRSTTSFLQTSKEIKHISPWSTAVYVFTAISKIVRTQTSKYFDFWCFRFRQS